MKSARPKPLHLLCGRAMVLYVLDAPSIGLHQRDNARLLATLKTPRDLGNTLIVVEHDENTMRQADFLVDIGPGAGKDGGHVIAAGSVEDIMATLSQGATPRLLVIDSIQTVLSTHLTSAPGSISQVRECTLQLMQLAKSTLTPIFIIGHVTKEGTVAGPKALEHIADAVLYLEGERYHSYRLLRGVKNRFGATHEIGVFEMQGEGMVEVANPSAVFLADRAIGATGSAVVVSMEGTRPLLVEVQALVTPSNFGNARCTTNGIEHNRLVMLLAVLTKRVGLAVGNHDVYANVVGGFTLEEPSIDLGVACAIASSYREKNIPSDMALIGEVGLSGELRAVSRLSLRVREAATLGFKRCIVPSAGRDQKIRAELEDVGLPADFKVLTASSLAVALEIALH